MHALIAFVAWAMRLFIHIASGTGELCSKLNASETIFPSLAEMLEHERDRIVRSAEPRPSLLILILQQIGDEPSTIHSMLHETREGARTPRLSLSN